MIRYNNILCVSYNEIVPSIYSFDAFRKAIERGKINRVRRASFESPALIEVASLPEKILSKLREKYGESSLENIPSMRVYSLRCANTIITALHTSRAVEAAQVDSGRTYLPLLVV